MKNIISQILVQNQFVNSEKNMFATKNTITDMLTNHYGALITHICIRDGTGPTNSPVFGQSAKGFETVG